VVDITFLLSESRKEILLGNRSGQTGARLTGDYQFQKETGKRGRQSLSGWRNLPEFDECPGARQSTYRCRLRRLQKTMEAIPMATKAIEAGSGTVGAAPPMSPADASMLLTKLVLPFVTSSVTT
jgi:hypothetical protein